MGVGLKTRVSIALLVVSLLFSMFPAFALAKSCPRDFPNRIPNGCRSATGAVYCDQGYEGGKFVKVGRLWIGKCFLHKRADTTTILVSFGD